MLLIPRKSLIDHPNETCSCDNDSSGQKYKLAAHGREKIMTYLLLKAEIQLCGSPRNGMETFDAISTGLLKQSASSSVQGHRQLGLEPIVPKHPSYSRDSVR